MYTSITFKNSLGQLPPVSFLTPRKILQFDSTAVKSSLLSPNCAIIGGDVRRFRSILLEIENFINRLIYYEDLMNPLMVLNLKRQKVSFLQKYHMRGDRAKVYHIFTVCLWPQTISLKRLFEKLKNL